MGTSTSRRSPYGDIRWRASRTALASGEPARAAEQLLTAAAAESWPAMLRSTALRTLAEAAEQALEELRASGAPRSEERITDVVEAAREQAVSHGDGGLLVALGERSLARVLLGQMEPREVTTGEDSVIQVTASGASLFFAETMRQLLLHLAARDLPGADLAVTARDARRRTRLIAAAGVEAVSPASELLEAGGSAAWTRAVDRVFRPPRSPAGS